MTPTPRIATALTRDMQGAQSRVLANRDWDELPTDSLSDTTQQVATAFARYPYPESFFTWRAAGDHRVVFFNRANRYPPWMPHTDTSYLTPVVVTVDPPGASELRRQIAAQAVKGFRYVAVNVTFAGEPYQVVARLAYTDTLHEHLQSVIGFTVSLAWVRRVYFAELLSQVEAIVNRGSRLDVVVLDDEGRLIWGRPSAPSGLVRMFPLLFLDPSASMMAGPPFSSFVKVWPWAARTPSTSKKLTVTLANLTCSGVSPVNVRVVGATNEALLPKLKDGTFREDLYYRLAVIPIEIPPLRERLEDVPLLVNHFLQKQASGATGETKKIDPKAVDILCHYDYPGNVRELENAIERACALCENDMILPSDLPPNIPQPATSAATG